MIRISTSCIAAAIIGLALAPARRAIAQPASAQAESLFRQGRDLMVAGKLDEACRAFESSQRLAPATTTLLNLAECREKNHEIATAWGLFVDVERQLRDATDPTSRELARAAETHARKLEPRLSKLTIHVAPAHQLPGLQIVRGTELIDAGTWNRVLPIDGGTYHFVARAPGHNEWSTTVTIRAEADTATLDVPELAETADEIPRPAPRRSLAAPIAVSVAATALGIGAVAFELSGEHLYDQTSHAADMPTQLSLWQSANHRRYVAEGLGAAAIGCAGTAIYLFVRGREQPRNDVAITPVASAGHVGLALSAAW